MKIIVTQTAQRSDTETLSNFLLFLFRPKIVHTNCLKFYKQMKWKRAHYHYKNIKRLGLGLSRSLVVLCKSIQKDFWPREIF